ncbi:hypothetical protein [Uliginosibacterium sp. 31-12]|uniref:hypothetical protein n=1 Tax=Uliginosibacterium sp. 31-12 TaxID=3062781 RepID=UPI0026E22BBE|nr:hypothetical protein [Uliginosibacterium sp. 31-12]MDO6386266.1 hypothetical protein [Uliginosibacterium sp. 31-12]
MHRSIKPAAGALLLSLILVACGGGGGDDSGSSTTTAAASSAAASSKAASSTAAATSSVSAAVSTTDWTFNDSAYAAADTALFAATYSSTGDNSIKALLVDGTLSAGDLSTALLNGSGQVSYDGLLFNSTAASVIRYRPTGNSSCANCWNTNGSFYTSNTTLLPAVGGDLNTNGNVRTYIAIPVTAGKAFTVTVNYKQTSTTATAGKIALAGSDNKLLVAKDCFASGTVDSITYSGAANHAYTHIKIFYGREGASGGGVNITSMQRVQ